MSTTIPNPDISAEDLLVAPLLRTLDTGQRQVVLDTGTVITADEGEAIVREGGTDRDLFVLLDGEASAVVQGGDGEVIQVATLQQGDSFGELAALLRERRAATIIATRPSRLLRIGGDDLLGLVQQIGPLGLALARELARDLEQALGERNVLQQEAAPGSVVIAPEQQEQTRTYVARYYLATVRNMLRRNRLLTADKHPSYSTEFRFSAGDATRWEELFGRPAGGEAVPYTFHTTAWTVLLMQLLEDLGISFRSLSHARAEHVRPPEAPPLEAGTTYRLQVAQTDTVPLGDNRVGIATQTLVLTTDGAVLLTSSDLFLVTEVDPGTVRDLRKAVKGRTTPLPTAPQDHEPLLDPERDGIEEVGLSLAGDLGTRYGQLSGNVNPVHTSRTAARLLGHPHPTLQHMAIANLVLRHLTDLRGAAPARMSMDFIAPVYVGQHVHLRMSATAFEVVDGNGKLLVEGRHGGRALDAGGGATADEIAPQADEASAALVDALLEEEGEDEEDGAPARLEVGDLHVDPKALQRYMERTHHVLRDRLKARLSEPHFAYPLGISKEEYREKVFQWLAELAEHGYGMVSLPQSVGGDDDPLGAVAVFETIGFGDLSLLIKYGVQFGLFGGAILNLGTSEHHQRWLAALGKVELPGGFALTELGHGSDARSIRTRAVYDPTTHEFVITTPDDDARKEYIGNTAVHGRMAAVFAQLEVGGEQHGVHALLVPLRDADGQPMPGVRIGDCGEKMGLNGVDNGRLWFDDVRVPLDALLNRYGNVSVDGKYSSPIENPGARFFTMLATLVQGRVSVALGANSASKSALTIATRYALRRRQFEGSGGEEVLLLDYMTHQRKLLPRIATAIALDFALHDLAADYAAITKATQPDHRARQKLESMAAGLKAMSTWHCIDTIQTCRESCGGAGYLAENRFAALKGDTDVFATFEGDNTVLLQLVTKTLLSDYKAQFEDMDFGDTVRFVLGRVAAAIIPTPASRNADPAHLRSRDFQLDAFRSREDVMVADLGQRLRRAVGKGMAGGEAFIYYQERVVAAAQAHIDRVVMESFAAAIDRCEDADLRAVLERVCDLHALSQLEKHRGWYTENGHFAGAKTRAMSNEVNRLCRELRPHARDLVDGFGIPDAMLSAPIGLQ